MFAYRAVRPLLFARDAEHAHELGIAALARMPELVERVLTRLCRCDDPRLAQRLWNLDFLTPIGVAAGLDKNGVAIRGLAALGGSHIEIGTVTGLAQPGNPLPRLFRLPADDAIINRMGFNNHGAAAVAARLAAQYDPARSGCRRPPGVLGINLGKSKVVELEHALDDYRASVAVLGALADYVVVNVSSPNTPGLRDLQGEALLRPLLAGVRAALDAVAPATPLLVKIAPDLSEAGIDAAVDAALAAGVQGLIATNTTIGRAGLVTSPARIAAIGAGGLSGAPLRTRSTAVLAQVARRLRAQGAALPLIGVGGVDSVAAAWAKIGAGANLVQVYSGLIYHGPGLISRMNHGLAELVEQHGLPSLAAAVGRNL